jgi:hypothetical protein
MTTAIISDQELMLVFSGKRMSARREYNVIFQHNFKTHNQFTFKTIWANNKVEATRFAREYGIRFIEARVVEVQKVGA